MKNIVLVGFMGVGKGRTARALADLTGFYAVDTDDLIESKVKNKIRNIFRVQGEQFFRESEKETALWLENHVRQTIISTGGGFFNVPNIKAIGKVVYLHSDVEEIIQSILRHHNAAKKIKKRPLLQDLDKAKQLFAERLPQYRQVADIEINVEQKQSEQVAEEIITKLQFKEKYNG